MPYVNTNVKPEEVAAGSGICVMFEEAQVGLFRTREGLFAIDNVCPHHGAPLHDGMMTEEYVTCPWHQWQFQLKDGLCRNVPGARVASFPVEVRDGTIWVELQTGTPS